MTSARTAISAVMLSLAGAICCLVNVAIATPGAFAQDANPPATTAESDPPGDELTAEQQEQINVLGPVLLNPSQDIAHSTRLGAARQLLAMRVEPAFAILREALATSDVSIVSAVVEAVAQSSRPVWALQKELTDTLRTCPQPVISSLAATLRLFGPAAIEPIAAIAKNTALPTAERTGAIFALSAFRSRAAAIELMELVDPSDAADPAAAPPAEIVAAACDALERMTGLEYGRNREAWRTWWREVKTLPHDQWLEILLDNLARQIGRLQAQVSEQKAGRSAIEQRLVEAYRENLRTITSIDGQLERIATFLSDALPAVRMVGLERVEILLRDAVAIPPQFQTTLAARLDDANPQIRRRAVALLDQMNATDLTQAINDRIATESDPQTAQAMVEALARRRSPAALPGLVAAFVIDALRPTAADGLWAVLTAHPQVISDQADTIAPLRTVLDELIARPSDEPIQPRVLRLWARLLDDARLADAIEFLDNEDAAIRAAVAAALAHRGARQPLIFRAKDAVIFPHTVAAVAAGPADLQNLRELTALTVPASVEPAILHDGIALLASKLPATLLIEADDILAGITGLPTSVRIQALERGVERPAESLPADLRISLIVRLSTLLLSTDANARAHQLLTGINGTADGSANAELTALRFFAAIRSGNFDAAAAVGKPTDAWIAELQLLSTRPEAIELAQRLHQDITTRFAQELTEAQLARLSTIHQTLAGNDDDDEQGAGGEGDAGGGRPSTTQTVGG